MELDKKEIDILENALHQWEQQQLLTREKTDELRSTLVPRKAGGQVAQYFFIIAIASMVLAFIAIFIDDKLLERVRLYFDVGNLIIAIACSGLSALWFTYIHKKRKTVSPLVHEIYMVLGGMVVLCATVYFCKDIGFGPQYTGLLLSVTFIFMLLSVLYKSKSLWMAAILALMGFYGSYAEWLQNDRNLFLGMNYPMRFAVFGLLVTGASFMQSKLKLLRFSHRQTFLLGMLILFTGLWGISIFGNFGEWAEWEKVRQVQVIGYSVVLAAASITSLVAGIRYKDDVARDFGIIFILLNLYSRYFEFFWNTTNKGIFFLVLAASFALVGWQLEKRVRRQGK